MDRSPLAVSQRNDRPVASSGDARCSELHPLSCKRIKGSGTEKGRSTAVIAIPRPVEFTMTSKIVPGLVTIVIPCYRGARWLGDAIESCLAQSYNNLEVIVVDDASPDSCATIAERCARADPRLRLIRRARNGGVARAFNSGFEASFGEFLTRLAQDDLFEPDAVERMVAALRAKGPRAGVAYCNCATIDEAGNNFKEIVTPPRPRAKSSGIATKVACV